MEALHVLLDYNGFHCSWMQWFGQPVTALLWAPVILLALLCVCAGLRRTGTDSLVSYTHKQEVVKKKKKKKNTAADRNKEESKRGHFVALARV